MFLGTVYSKDGVFLIDDGKDTLQQKADQNVWFDFGASKCNQRVLVWGDHYKNKIHGFMLTVKDPGKRDILRNKLYAIKAFNETHDENIIIEALSGLKPNDEAAVLLITDYGLHMYHPAVRLQVCQVHLPYERRDGCTALGELDKRLKEECLDRPLNECMAMINHNQDFVLIDGMVFEGADHYE